MTMEIIRDVGGGVVLRGELSHCVPKRKFEGPSLREGKRELEPTSRKSIPHLLPI